MENIPSLEGTLGRKISKNRRYYYPASTNKIAPPRSIDGNPTFDLKQCTANKIYPVVFYTKKKVKFDGGYCTVKVEGGNPETQECTNFLLNA
jgi:hypothetical protein